MTDRGVPGGWDPIVLVDPPGGASYLTDMGQSSLRITIFDEARAWAEEQARFHQCASAGEFIRRLVEEEQER